ncbi:hypothetical protein KJ866_02165 [Patescibacteria group bacterium]|nr:hypothetical protein [Patescibacteria group bacterium]MBU2220229.1 hypothetical protein [Patescibacteria group bacterium]MBU2265079.1 hypothetical protein [Patescibacteria group bacterium]
MQHIKVMNWVNRAIFWLAWSLMAGGSIRGIMLIVIGQDIFSTLNKVIPWLLICCAICSASVMFRMYMGWPIKMTKLYWPFNKLQKVPFLYVFCGLAAISAAVWLVFENMFI